MENNIKISERIIKELLEVTINNETFKINDIVDIINSGYPYSYFMISHIFLNDKNEIYFGMKNPHNNYYFGNSDSINNMTISHTKRPELLKIIRERKLNQIFK